MPALKEIPQSACVAWSPVDSHKTLIALGGRGVNAHLSLVDLNLADTSRRGYDVGKEQINIKTPVSVDLGGNPVGCLAWAAAEDVLSAPLGYLAAGFDDGTVKFWNPNEFLREGLSDGLNESRRTPVIYEVAGRSLVATVKCEQSATCLSFNPVRPSLIACGYSDGMMNIVNMDNPGAPEIYEPGNEPAKAHGGSCVTAVAWNKTVQHVLASTCSNGSTTIWNLRQRKPSIRFRDPAGRLRPSSVAWLPNQATQVVVAYDDDTNPSFQMWDLRNSSFPFKEFPGHTRGIVDIQFSDLDSSMMLSSGKDNRIVCWALDDTGGAPTIFSELASPEWYDSVRWSPCLPGLIAASSHVEGVVVESIHERRNPTSKHIPRWHKRPSGVSFGFGGKLVSFNETSGTLVRCDIISSTDADLIRQADEFETTLVNGDYLGYCEKRIHESEDEHEKLTWQVVQTLFYPPDQRSSALLDRLGFCVDEVLSSVASFLGRRPGKIFDSAIPSEEQQCAGVTSSALGGANANLNASGLNDNSEQAVQAMLNQSVTDAESFFNNLGEKACQDENVWNETAASSISEEQDIVVRHSQRQTTAGSKLGSEQLRSSTDALDYTTGGDLLIKTSLLVAQRPIAVELCMESDRWADALLLAATSGDRNLWEKTQNLYLKRRLNDKFLQMVGCIINENWAELVKLADLAKWEETLVILASYVPFNQFTSLCRELGLRLERERFDIRAAVVCYLAAGSFASAAQIWSSLSVSANRGKSLQKGLQDLVEKLAVLKKATNYQLDDLLFNQKVSQYAEVLANSGRLVAGMKFLCLVGSESTDLSARSSTGILCDRIYNASPQAMIQAGIPPPQTLPFSKVEVMTAMPAQVQEQHYDVYRGVRLHEQQPPYQQQHQQRPLADTSYLRPAPQPSSLPYGQGPFGAPSPPPQQTIATGSSTSWGSPTPGSIPSGQSRPPLPASSSMNAYHPVPGDVSFGNRQFPPSASTRPPMAMFPASATGMPPARPPQSQILSGSPAVPPIRPQFSTLPSTPAQTSHQFIQPSIHPPQTPGFPMHHSGVQTPLSSQIYSGAAPIMNGSPVGPASNVMQPQQQRFPVSTQVAAPPAMTNGYPPSGQPSSNYAAPPTKSTAPTAGVVNLPSGMPVPWPIPTGTQQVGSTTQSTAPANQKIQSTSTSKGEGIPMGTSDLAFVQRIVFGCHSQFTQHDPSTGRESEKLRQTLSEMVNQLQSGVTSRPTQDLVLQYCRAMEVGDLTAASQIQAQMVKTAWTKESRVWLPSLKRIMTK